MKASYAQPYLWNQALVLWRTHSREKIQDSTESFESDTMRVALLLLASLLISTTLGVEVGDEICVEGYIMDVLCIDIGRLLDNWSFKTLERPGEHSVHCLADVGACIRSGFEVLLDPTEGERYYTRGWRLDEAGTQQVVELARSVGRCSTCTGEGSLRKGFRAALTATILDLVSGKCVTFVTP